MASLFDEFDEIKVVNLPERRDRRRALERELQSLGLSSSRVQFFSAIRPASKGEFSSIGARGCYESHLQILREARESGRSVLILEDDCTFDLDALECVTPMTWDIFYGGYYPADPTDLATSDIIGSHMMGFSREGASMVANYLENLTHEGIHPPIDGAYVWFRRANPWVRTHFAVPPIARQRRSRSDIADLKLYDRLPVIKSLANALRSWRD